MLSECLSAAAEAIAKSNFLIISAGAGMSADSGLPTFRGNNGFWRNYPAIQKLGLSFVECANPSHFYKDPHFGWAFYGHRYNLYKAATPHLGYQILKQWTQGKKYGFFVFTSNVDGHFEKAGFDVNKIVECHGSVHYLQCLNQCTDDIWPCDDLNIEIDESVFRARDPLPMCPRCHRLARPNILMFGDWGWVSNRTDRQEARLQEAISHAERQGDCVKTVIEIGAGSAVPTVQHFSQSQLLIANSTLIRINRDDEEPYLQGKTIYLPLTGLDAVTRINALLETKS